jgi:protein-S-isoprenylcysteine O-methyltransferase Ste14
MNQVHMSLLEKTGGLFFKYRDYTPIPIVIAGILFAEPSLTSLILGFVVSLLGELIRAYGVAFIGTISRTRSMSNGNLVSEGPFSLLRNPLYFGNLILSIGLSLMTAVWWLPLLTAFIFYFQYIPIVAWEEWKLKGIFGDSYLNYQKNVPNRWFPNLSKLLNGNWLNQNIEWAPAWKSEKRTLTSVISFTALMILFFILNENTFPLIDKIWPK